MKILRIFILTDQYDFTRRNSSKQSHIKSECLRRTFYWYRCFQRQDNRSIFEKFHWQHFFHYVTLATIFVYFGYLVTRARPDIIWRMCEENSNQKFKELLFVRKYRWYIFQVLSNGKLDLLVDCRLSVTKTDRYLYPPRAYLNFLIFFVLWQYIHT